jgi:hypothetical protein
MAAAVTTNTGLTTYHFFLKERKKKKIRQGYSTKRNKLKWGKVHICKTGMGTGNPNF